MTSIKVRADGEDGGVKSTDRRPKTAGYQWSEDIGGVLASSLGIGQRKRKVDIPGPRQGSRGGTARWRLVKYRKKEKDTREGIKDGGK